MPAREKSGLVFLDTDHHFVRERLVRKLIVEREEGFDGKAEHVYVVCCDFNNVEMLAHCSKKTKKFCVSVKLPCFDELVEAGALEVLKAQYGDLLLADANEPYGRGAKWNVTACVDLNAAELPEPAEQLVDKLANLGRNLCGAPFYRALTALVDGTTGDVPPLTLHYRPNEQTFVIPSAHVVQVIFSLAFVDRVDQELARVFTVEFAESGREVEKAPGVNFYPPGRQPDELRDMPHEVDDTCVGYIVFAISQMHVNTPGKLRRVCDLMVQFRSYLLYHIKCTKTHLHSMMRSTYSKLLKVLERANPTVRVVKNLRKEEEE